MDEKSLEILEFHEILKILVGYTSTPMGSELVNNIKPVTEYDVISLRLRQSAEARQLLSVNSGISAGVAFDIREAVSMAALGKILEPAKLIEIQQTLAVMRQVRSGLMETPEQFPLLWDIAKDITNFHQVENEIGRCLSPGGEVLDRASQRLAAVRTQLKEARKVLREKLESILRTPRGRKIIQEPIITEREGRYVIPIKNEFRKQIKGITHDVSNTGATVFVEPWTTVELGNTMRELVTEERREIEKILRELSQSIGVRKEEILTSISRLAELDVILAKARYARSVKASEPGLVKPSDSSGNNHSDMVIKLVNARHPLLGQKAIPLSVEIGKDFSTLVITGPNTGGKTVALKTIGLMALMTQAGIPIPASPESRLPVFDGVFADIGDEQSIEQTLSSFSWHMGNIVRIIDNSTDRSLVLLDELGTSTDPAEGSALARSILTHLLSSRTLTVATTHYGDLKVFAHVTPGMQNASFDFDPTTLKPTYHMTPGIPGGSNALAIAASLGLTPAIIDDAKKLISKGALDLEATLNDIMAEKQRVKDLGDTLEKEKNLLNTQNIELESRIKKLRNEERQAIDEARDRIVREAAELHREIRQASSELRKKRTKEAIDSSRKSLSDVRARLDSDTWNTVTLQEEADRTISAGDTVYLREMDIFATVTSISEESQEVEVKSGQVTLKVRKNRLEKVSSGNVTHPVSPAKTTRFPAGAASPELDLRGKRAEEVEVSLDSYLNDVTLVNLNEVVIIHGFGTGTVRQIVRDFLKSHPLVKSFRPGAQGEGGDGVTVVRL
jgi:DNA mismatch repair protein MutS2